MGNGVVARLALCSVGAMACTVVTVAPDGGAPGSTGGASGIGAGPSSGGGASGAGTAGAGGSAGQSSQDGGSPDGADGVASDSGNGTDGSIVRTLVYHQVTTETTGVDTSKGLAFSRDGSRAVFVVSESTYNVTVVNADGSGRHVVEPVSA